MGYHTARDTYLGCAVNPAPSRLRIFSRSTFADCVRRIALSSPAMAGAAHAIESAAPRRRSHGSASACATIEAG
jgi:hypothetical protein